ncbi:MAG: acetate kinase [Oscillospiraceae bacterium]|nr:acetate kinase [Oscillospiraceae bacterium]
MNILVINAGSSSLKYQLIDMNTETAIAKGLCERIGIDGHFTHTTSDKRKVDETCDFPTHTEAFERVVAALTTGTAAVIGSMDEINAVGHRVVHGGEVYSKTVLLTEEVIKTIEDLKEFAPLHNPANALAIRSCLKVIPANVPQAGVFDTAFHQTIPSFAFTYGLPYECYEKYGIRKYGFHGSSHRFVCAELAERTGRKLSEMKIVSCHLGNGSSIAAVCNGKSIDTTMGFTPLDGLLMGTRCGALDPSVVAYLQKKLNLSPDEIDSYMNKKSGLLGVSGVSSDNREVGDAAMAGNERAILATAILRYGIKKNIGAYAAAMGGLDAVIFTGGIGENAADIRRDACLDMEFLGIDFDVAKNAAPDTRATFAKLTKEGSKTEVWIVPTNEELMIAKDTQAVIG